MRAGPVERRNRGIACAPAGRRIASVTLRTTPGQREDIHMRWNKPKIVEVALGGEINSYACAKLT